MIQLILALVITGLAVLGLRWFLVTAPQTLGQLRRRLLLWGGVVILVLLAATGRLSLLVPLVGALIAGLLRLAPLLVQLLPLLQRLWRQRAGSGRTAGVSGKQRSTVEARYLRMHLDLATGDISGEILAGAFAGRDLHGLSTDELARLYRQCLADDRDSAALLEAYLDRLHGASWRQWSDQAGSGAGQEAGEMSREEALQVLGLAATASRAEIVQAHRRLMQKLHPDRGGSDYLAAKINRAKDVLMG